MAPLDPPGPVILTAEQATWLGRPPRPYDPNVAIMQPDGRPTEQFHLFLLKQWEWERRLYAVLTGEG